MWGEEMLKGCGKNFACATSKFGDDWLRGFGVAGVIILRRLD